MENLKIIWRTFEENLIACGYVRSDWKIHKSLVLSLVYLKKNQLAIKENLIFGDPSLQFISSTHITCIWKSVEMFQKCS